MPCITGEQNTSQTSSEDKKIGHATLRAEEKRCQEPFRDAWRASDFVIPPLFTKPPLGELGRDEYVLEFAVD